jgi:hypothetical protein
VSRHTLQWERTDRNGNSTGEVVKTEVYQSTFGLVLAGHAEADDTSLEKQIDATAGRLERAKKSEEILRHGLLLLAYLELRRQERAE